MIPPESFSRYDFPVNLKSVQAGSQAGEACIKGKDGALKQTDKYFKTGSRAIPHSNTGFQPAIRRMQS
jgi:hypothetical protein